MLRACFILVIAAACFCLTAFRAENPFSALQPSAVNTTVAQFFSDAKGIVPFTLAPQGEQDIVSSSRILMLNYCAYDSAYAYKMRQTIALQFPNNHVTDFWEGSSDDLQNTLTGKDIVILVYPSSGSEKTLKSYGHILQQFVRQGGNVLITGTHEYGVLQQLDLIGLDYGYFCRDLKLKTNHAADHPITDGVPAEVFTAEFAYPLDVSDPSFVTLASILDYPVVGYKTLGQGKIVYLGLEYFSQESGPTQLLINALRWLEPAKQIVPSPPVIAENNPPNRSIVRSEEFLQAGRNIQPTVHLNIYPNPYASKAALDFELEKPASVMIEVTDETGRLVTTMLPRRNLSAGIYHFDMPNLAPGIYFVTCRIGDQKSVKKVVKTV